MWARMDMAGGAHVNLLGLVNVNLLGLPPDRTRAPLPVHSLPTRPSSPQVPTPAGHSTTEGCGRYRPPQIQRIWTPTLYLFFKNGPEFDPADVHGFCTGPEISTIS